MAQTFSIDTKGYIVNEYLTRKLAGGKTLVTTRHGGWAILDEKEYALLRHGEVEADIELYNLLRQEGIILTEDTLSAVTTQHCQKFHQLFGATTLHILTPTLRCNQKCVYCYANSRPLKDKQWDMDRKTAKSIVDFIFQCPSGRITIEFQGGEPLLNFPILQYVVEYAKKLSGRNNKAVNFRVVTNLTLMNEKILDWLVENNVELNTSLDGPQYVHDKNRFYENMGGCYADVVEQLACIKKRGVQIGLMPTITRGSLPYWKEIIDEYVRQGQPGFWARRMGIGGFAVERWKEIGYSVEEYLDFWKKCVEYIFELNLKGTRFSEGYVGIILKNVIFSKRYNSFVCMASPCGCAWSQVSYDYQGNIFACDEARSFEIFRLGNVKDTTYPELYSSWDILNIVDLTSGNSFDCANCAYHPFCGPCIVDEYGEHGSIVKKPDSFNCRVKRGMLDYVFGEVIPNKERFKIAQGWVGVGRNEAIKDLPENSA
ncbi:MAG: His-Xaa-Ser system radical SAM maturase HxsB [Candidatus Aenigmarchaeota archaeon]|nr:His-Xaa-Ser system radical SAM maturase HxsB [Candidatus Aenigmarchaeota archaeon]